MSKKRRKTLKCPNCENNLETEDNYCNKCGQENHNLKIPLGHLVYEVIEGITHFDNKLFKTLKVFFSAPGKITEDFLEGKRVSYVHPVRLYIFVSFLFFLISGFFVNKELSNNKKVENSTSEIFNENDFSLSNFLTENEIEKEGFKNVKDFKISSLSMKKRDMLNSVKTFIAYEKIKVDSLLKEQKINGTNKDIERALVFIENKYKTETEKNIILSAASKEYEDSLSRVILKEFFSKSTDAQIDSLLNIKTDDLSSFERFLIKKIVTVDYSKDDFLKVLIQKILKMISPLMFLLMPGVALILFVFWDRKRFYYEHLIFSVHIHSFLFIVFSLLFLINSVLPTKYSETLTSLVFTGLAIYIILALKRVYHKGWISTTVRFLCSFFPYFLFVCFILIIAMLAGFINY
jgi:hypothetical protein